MSVASGEEASFPQEMEVGQVGGQPKDPAAGEAAPQPRICGKMNTAPGMTCVIETNEHQTEGTSKMDAKPFRRAESLRTRKTVSAVTSRLRGELEAKKRLLEMKRNVRNKKMELQMMNKKMELQMMEEDLVDEISLFEEEQKIRHLELQDRSETGRVERDNNTEDAWARTSAWVKQVQQRPRSSKEESSIEGEAAQDSRWGAKETDVPEQQKYGGEGGPDCHRKSVGVETEGHVIQWLPECRENPKTATKCASELKRECDDIVFDNSTGKCTLTDQIVSDSDVLSKCDVRRHEREIVVKDVTDKELPRFYGNPIRWAEFKSAFDSTTAKYRYDNSENLARIRKALGGEAYEAVVDLFGNADNVPKILKMLERQFGRPEQVLKAIIKRIEAVPVPDVNKPATVLTFGRAVVSFACTAASLKDKAYLQNPYLLQTLVERLPVSMRRGWLRWTRGSNRQQNFETFSEWIEEEMELACELSPSFEEPTHGRNERKKVQTRGAHPVYALNTEKQEICVCCSRRGHCLKDCWSFGRKSFDEKWKFLKSSKVCFSCLELGHRVFQCTKKARCGINGCAKSHHKILHEEKCSVSERNAAAGAHNVSKGIVENTHNSEVAEAAMSTLENHIEVNRPSGDKPDQVVSTQNFLSFTRATCYRAIIPVRMFGPNSSKIKYVLVDTGADDTLVSSKTAVDLGLEGPSCTYSFTGATGRTVKENTKLISCDVRGLFRGAQKLHFRNVVVVGQMVLQPYNLNLDQLRKDYPHLRRIRGRSLNGVVPDMIVGMDNLQHITTKQVIEGPPGTPIAVRCNLGWIIGGVSNTNTSSSLCHIAATWNEENDRLHQLVKSFFSLENFGVSGQRRNFKTKLEQRAETILEESTRFLPDQKRWEAGLLYSNDNICFPESYDNAYTRLLGIERRMKRDLEYAQSYSEKIQEYKDKGYISLVRSPRLQEAKTWYIPHFGVVNPNKPGKFRLVFDAASKVKGVSLNSQLLPGLDRMLRLDEVLLNLRLHDIILTGDVNEMFHRVFVRKDDRESQQFLWRDGDASREPDRYVMNVLIFGASSSPTTAIYAMNKNAERFRNVFPRAVNAIHCETYMDDVLTGGRNEEDVINLRREVSFVCEEGGFTVAKWESNSKKVLESIPSDLRANGAKEVLEGGHCEITRTLGMWIDHRNDCFTYLCRFQKVEPAILEGKRPTKRELCRLVMSLFDPLGLIGHFKVKGLMLLQSTWRSGIGWDDEVPEDVFVRWKNWINILKTIENVSVPRRFAPAIQEAKFVQIHTFVDASTEGYAAVTYLRIRKENRIWVTLVASKSRVSPIKKQTIPRLELLAAVLGVRLTNHICEILHIKINSRVFWSDSCTVLAWIRSEAGKFKEFVANRVSEIQENSDVSDWRWIPTALNVADEATRFDKKVDLSPEARWFTGPDFLRHGDEHWPKRREELDYHKDHDTAIIMPVQVTPINRNSRLERFSTWNRTIRSYAAEEAAFIYWRNRARANICKKKGEDCNIVLHQPWEMEKDGLCSHLDRQVLQTAEVRILKEMQQEVFEKELRSLKNDGCLSKKNCLRRLGIELGTDGLLRIKGRIGAAVVDADTAMPILLPKNHHVTRLIVEKEHRNNAHVGQDTIFNNLRQRFWVIGGRTSVRKMCLNCQECRIRNAKPIIPEMGNLPWYRLAYRQPPFTFTGIDFFGPFEVTVGRHREKRWGCICVCLVTRAVHLEVAYGLSTDELMLVLSRFVDVRGKPRIIVSDNGTNMVGANREIKKAVSEMDLNHIKSHPCFRELEWRFIPPAAPHFGGAWEALVKTVKTAIFHILKEKHPKDQVLMTVFKGAENIVNSRPLYRVSSDPEDPESLTPNHFLRGTFDAGPTMSGVFDDSEEFLRKQWRISQLYINKFWDRWTKNYLPTLLRAKKWTERSEAIEVGDIVFVVDDQKPRNTWSRGIISKVFPGKDGIIRVVEVTRYDIDSGKKLYYRRPVHKICPIGRAKWI